MEESVTKEFNAQWYKSTKALEILTQTLSEIHETYPGKENTDAREEQLKPLREACIKIGYWRYQLVKEMRNT